LSLQQVSCSVKHKDSHPEAPGTTTVAIIALISLQGDLNECFILVSPHPRDLRLIQPWTLQQVTDWVKDKESHPKHLQQLQWRYLPWVPWAKRLKYIFFSTSITLPEGPKVNTAIVIAASVMLGKTQR
jgi:hypothetical protein